MLKNGSVQNQVWPSRKCNRMPAVSAMGQNRTCGRAQAMSALPLKADIDRWHLEVCFGPQADISWLIRLSHRRAGRRKAALCHCAFGRRKQLIVPIPRDFTHCSSARVKGAWGVAQTPAVGVGGWTAVGGDAWEGATRSACATPLIF
jgi:hypothetical protein